MADENQISELGDLERSTKEELMDRAKELDIEGRSSMSKEELAQAVAAAQPEALEPPPVNHDPNAISADPYQGGVVARAEYDRVVAENHDLRKQLGG